MVYTAFYDDNLNFGASDSSIFTGGGGKYEMKQCSGFVRCDYDIPSEVVGWVIGKNGSSIKDLKNRTGCTLWVDQSALKLTITGVDAHAVQEAIRSVNALVSSAPIQAGSIRRSVTETLECPHEFLDIVGTRVTVAAVVKETRAQVVVNKKIGSIIIRGSAHAVNLAKQRLIAIIDRCVLEAAIQQKLGRSYGLDNDAESVGSISSARAGTSANSSTPSSPNNTWSLFSSPFSNNIPSLVTSTSSTSLSSASGAPYVSPRALKPIQGQQPINAAPGHRASPPTVSQSMEVPNGMVFNSGAPVTPRMAQIAVKDSDSTTTLSTSAASSSTTTSSTFFASSPHSSSHTSITDVCELLESLQLSRYTDLFTKAEVDLEALTLMEDSDYTAIGVPKGPQVKIVNALRKANLRP